LTPGQRRHDAVFWRATAVNPGSGAA